MKRLDRVRAWAFVAAIAGVVPSLVVCCGGDDVLDSGADAPDGTTRPDTTTDGAPGNTTVDGGLAQDVLELDVTLDVTSGGDADASFDADAVGPPLVLSYLAFCGNVAAGGRAAVYGIDDVTGALLHVDQDPATAGVQDFSAGVNTIISAVHPLGRALYCGRYNFNAKGIETFAFGDGGVLSPLTGVAMTDVPLGLAPHPGGGHLYALGGNNNLNATSIYNLRLGVGGDTASGTEYAGWGGNGSGWHDVVVDRLGRFVFVGGGGELWVQKVSATDAGALTMAPFHLKDGGGFDAFYVGAMGSVQRLAAHPSKDVIYATFSSAKVAAFAYDPTTGALSTLVERSTGSGAQGLVVHPDGTHLYVVHESAPTIGHYSVAGDGSLSLPSSITVATANAAVGMDPSGKYLYARYGEVLRGYSTAADGGLTALPMGAVPCPGAARDLPTFVKP